jgi:hypothetical protein
MRHLTTHRQSFRAQSQGAVIFAFIVRLGLYNPRKLTSFDLNGLLLGGEIQDLRAMARRVLFRVALPNHCTPRIAKIFLPSLRQRAHSAAIRWITGGSSLLFCPTNSRSAHHVSSLAFSTDQMNRRAFRPFFSRHSTLSCHAT